MHALPRARTSSLDELAHTPASTEVNDNVLNTEIFEKVVAESKDTLQPKMEGLGDQFRFENALEEPKFSLRSLWKTQKADVLFTAVYGSMAILNFATGSVILGALWTGLTLARSAITYLRWRNSSDK